MNSLNCDHLSQDLILRALDDELTAAEGLTCESHLAVCDLCREKLSNLRAFSFDIEAAVYATPIPSMESARHDLQQALESRHSNAAAGLEHPGKVMRRFGWGMGIAATLALGVLMAPRHDTVEPQLDVVEPAGRVVQSAAIEVDGETFMTVPYSNADLPISAPHIVQMQVPISSLADVGIVLEPVANRFSGGSDSERSVLANVLIGTDGQPLGVHVLGSD